MATKSSDPILNYDVFISYKSEEASWAERLAETLDDYGKDVWRDHDAKHGLRPGELWSEAIESAISKSKTMIVLWSALAAKNVNTVMLNEIRTMETELVADKKRGGSRRIIPVSLDGTKKLYNPLRPYHHLGINFKDLYKRYHKDGAHQVSAVEWTRAVKPLLEAVGVTNLKQIRFVVAAMNSSQAEELWKDPDRYATKPDAFRRMRALIALTSQIDAGRYGASPDDWKPFPQVQANVTVRDLFDAYDNARRQWERENNIKPEWMLVSYSSQVLDANPEERQAAHEELKDEPCLLIIDPISLLHKGVHDRFVIDASLWGHNKSFIIGVAPFVPLMHADLFTAAMAVEKELAQSFERAYARFHKYFEPNNRECVMHIDHERQFMKWLQVAAESSLTAQRAIIPFRSTRPDQAMMKRVEQWPRGVATPQVVLMGSGDAQP